MLAGKSTVRPQARHRHAVRRWHHKSDVRPNACHDCRQSRGLPAPVETKRPSGFSEAAPFWLGGNEHISRGFAAYSSGGRGSFRNTVMMKYRGYVASVEFDDSADILHGRVFGNRPYPLATFEATETRQLRREFNRSVERVFALVRRGWRRACGAIVRHAELPSRPRASWCRGIGGHGQAHEHPLVDRLDPPGRRPNADPTKPVKCLGHTPGVQTT